VAEAVFRGKSLLSPSENDYDWLGHGVYFWEHNAQRAYEFACGIRDKPRHGKHAVRKPAVVGAIIELGFCLNLLDGQSIELVQRAHADLVHLHEEANEPLPRNEGGTDRLKRTLDCAVIELLHAARLERNEDAFDSVRAAFIEGNPVYENAGFYLRSHIQICVRKAACIKGYFRPLDVSGKPMVFA
jgi:hypothetical protein